MINSLRLRSNQKNDSTPTTPLLDSLINTNAQVAFRNNDIAKSIEAHVPRKIDDEPHKSITYRKGALLYLKSSISFGSYSVLFCIASVFILESLFVNIAHINGELENLGTLLTVVILIGTALAFAFVEASNKRLEINFYESEKRRETWEYDNYVEGEQREMVELYCKKGMANEDADQVVTLLSKYRELFIDIMMAEELNLIPTELNLTPLLNGLTAFISYITFGMVPLIPFLIPSSSLERSTVLILFIMVAEIELFFIGAAKSKFYTGIWWREGLISACSGIISIIGSIGACYALGYSLKFIQL